MTENKILEFEFSARSQAVDELTPQQPECLDHEIQTNPQPTESYEIQWNLSLRKPHREFPQIMWPNFPEVRRLETRKGNRGPI